MTQKYLNLEGTYSHLGSARLRYGRSNGIVKPFSISSDSVSVQRGGGKGQLLCFLPFLVPSVKNKE